MSSEYTVEFYKREQDTKPDRSYQFPTDEGAVLFGYRHAKSLGLFAWVLAPNGEPIAEFNGVWIKKHLPKHDHTPRKVPDGKALQALADEGRVKRGLAPHGKSKTGTTKTGTTKTGTTKKPVKRLRKVT